MPPPRWDETMANRLRRTKWGVDSSVRADDQIVWDGQPMSNYDYVFARIGRYPDFWGRYIGSAGTQVQSDEIRYLHRKRCKIAFIYNGFRARPQDRVRYRPHEMRIYRGRANGEWTARKAIEIANGLNPGQPDGIRIYADIEDWTVDEHWIRGWQETMRASRFAGAGGLYGRSGHVATNRAFLRRIGTPEFSDRRRTDPVQWTRHRQSRWSRAADRAGADYDREQDQAITDFNRPLYHSYSRFVWSNDPRRHGDPQTLEELFPPTFGATDVPGGTESVVWQYRLQCYYGGAGSGGPLDLDYAQQAAFDEMW